MLGRNTNSAPKPVNEDRQPLLDDNDNDNEENPPTRGRSPSNVLFSAGEEEDEFHSTSALGPPPEYQPSIEEEGSRVMPPLRSTIQSREARKFFYMFRGIVHSDSN